MMRVRLYLHVTGTAEAKEAMAITSTARTMLVFITAIL